MAICNLHFTQAQAQKDTHETRASVEVCPELFELFSAKPKDRLVAKRTIYNGTLGRPMDPWVAFYDHISAAPDDTRLIWTMRTPVSAVRKKAIKLDSALISGLGDDDLMPEPIYIRKRNLMFGCVIGYWV